MNNKINNMPGFAAEHSLYRTDRRFHTGVSDTLFVLNAEVIPQLRCLWAGGDLICGGIPVGGDGGGGGDHRPIEARCRAFCLRTKRGAAQKKCLAEC